MRIGVLILPSAPWVKAQDMWRTADDMGFAHAWTSDHIAWQDMIGKEWYSAVPTLAAAAVVTRRIKLGTLVSSPNLRHPVPYAKEVVTVNEMSSGRFILGIGAGGSGVDATCLGQDQEWTPIERAERFAEFVELMASLLSNPITGADGKYYQARQAPITPVDATPTHIPLAVAANGKRGMALAARHGDIWVTNGRSPRNGVIPPVASPDDVAGQVRQLENICETVGRDPSTQRRLLMHVNKEPSALASLDVFRETVDTYRRVGITDMVVPFPGQAPFDTNMEVLEQVAGILSEL
ncbi:LLM class flavin-dependent oxidoreductase [Salinispora arenicola]|uniref:Luciferase n=1 Tax=Salinispora arenicola TaxID=168697 RepID=A0A542XV19_SALAC|nr:LLM class flavin-dependent oxidoreductase [Salinispora arenicola]NIL59148.1 LLM class flavin-dependent oxidoreductase [Salinispora arenicola]NIL63289.1 LLM class flavin-dependent oxidoreductase [Salinispora arenicola]TQL39681.1 luciferase-like monooxygenase [Salinispora arenicola]GIM81279.1 luciferase [Salinispora arenicola]